LALNPTTDSPKKIFCESGAGILLSSLFINNKQSSLMQSIITLTTAFGRMAGRSLPVLCFLFLAICSNPALSTAQSVTEEAKVLQKTLDIPELQSFYLRSEANVYKQVCIMQYPVAFSASVTANKFGQQVAFLTRDKVGENLKSYFLFDEFAVEASQASVKATYYYEVNAQLKFVKLHAEFKKADGQWVLSSSSLEKQ
jgi:hypothetical protein